MSRTPFNSKEEGNPFNKDKRKTASVVLWILLLSFYINLKFLLCTFFDSWFEFKSWENMTENGTRMELVLIQTASRVRQLW